MATIFPTSDEFAALAATHGVVPVWTELEADAETPVTAFAKITSPDEPAFLFESAEQDEKSGRYSILGTGAEREFIARGDRFEIRRDGQTIRSGTAPDPLAELEREMSGLRAPAGSLHFPGGCVGYLSYDAIRYFEPTVPPPPHDELGLPDLYFFTTDRILVFYHLTRRLKIIVNAYPEADPRAAYDQACAKLRSLVAQLQQPAHLPPSPQDDAAIKEEIVSNTA